ncbi:MAG TPA: hypothetical protein DEA08_21770 [Planctomycetes bacterium]|nr:hypothetical protein [Planctomycetota bacterium]
MGSGLEPWEIGQGRVALYLALAKFDVGKLDELPHSALAEICELWRSLPERARDLGAGYTLEIEILGIRASSILVGGEAAELRRLLARCRALRARAQHWGIYTLAGTEKLLLSRLEDRRGLVDMWQDALRRLEEDRGNPRAGAPWVPDHIRWRILVSLGGAQLQVNPLAALEVRESLRQLRPVLEQVMRAFNAKEDNIARAIELDRARLAVGACLRLGRTHYEQGLREIVRSVVPGAVGENPDLGFEAAELCLEAKALNEAARVIRLLHEAKLAAHRIAPLEAKLEALRAAGE